MKPETRNLKLETIALIGLSEKAYNEAVEQLGYEFAERYTLHNEWSVNYLTRSAAYWNWWKKQWNLREEVFYTEYADYAGAGAENELFELWLQHHSPDHVEGYPSPYIIQRAWEEMINNVDKEKGGVLC
jgi:hypothetical protein